MLESVDAGWNVLLSFPGLSVSLSFSSLLSLPFWGTTTAKAPSSDRVRVSNDTARLGPAHTSHRSHPSLCGPSCPRCLVTAHSTQHTFTAHPSHPELGAGPAEQLVVGRQHRDVRAGLVLGLPHRLEVAAAVDGRRGIVGEVPGAKIPKIGGTSGKSGGNRQKTRGEKAARNR